MGSKKHPSALWAIWLFGSVGLAIWLSLQLVDEDAVKTAFIPGPMTHGHHQIEMQCSVCHGPGFDSETVLQNACIDCHGEQLEDAQDSHPKSKFTDPRNADRLANVDARLCVSCHVEHRPELDVGLGVTLPMDMCGHCHEGIAEDRPSHEGMGFDTCANAGCHNFHDNRALYEDFLLAHSDEPWLKPPARQPPRNLLARQMKDDALLALMRGQGKAPEGTPTPEHWEGTAHAQAGVTCTACHGAAGEWVDSPQVLQCATCHKPESEGFLQGRHGMRLAQGLAPMTPSQSVLNMHVEASHRELTCISCHGAHDFDTQRAAVDSCIGCHNDEHSNEYLRSPHHDLWKKEKRGELPPGSGVTCASCHMPREEHRDDIFVQHNQSLTMRPVEKMVRPVCLQCHSLAFSLDALADPHLLENNFNGKPEHHVPSIDMAVDRDEARDKKIGPY
ncbi:NrfA- nitrite reduction protein [Alcanivorax sp. 97CO-5]|uniref:cytochrome c3 family protein n=1 Tax=unclassified Alcanivorax TaxID=2638842 RepID=UPI0003E7DDF1|nr:MULTISPECIES: cytochrome c3 family protein [unclassified Alcanivorax]EUC71685.1 NrfA- nitrite reduction protein [Alcanivorax sp. 97CO-5]PKG03103.1 NrfA- nitrite reduction protein [Alcanivorax sp. 97CO-6]